MIVNVAAMKRIAIYLTNTDRSAFAARHNSDAEKVITRLKGAGAAYVYEIFDVTDGVFADQITAFDAVVITGSPAYVDDDEPWIARLLDDIRKLVTAKTPLIGLCFGHQAIIAALGGGVAKKTDWIFGGAEFDIFQTREWMEPRQSHLKLYAANKAQAIELPEGFELLGGSTTCPIALTALGDHVMTTQFHPEMSPEFIAALTDEYAEHLGPKVAAAAWASLTPQADGPLFGQWMRAFIELSRGR